MYHRLLLLQPQQITVRNLLENNTYQILSRFGDGRFAHHVNKNDSNHDFSEIFEAGMHVLWRNDRTASATVKESGKCSGIFSIISVVYKKIVFLGKLCTSAVTSLILVPPVKIAMIETSLGHLFSLFLHTYWTSKIKFQKTKNRCEKILIEFFLKISVFIYLLKKYWFNYHNSRKIIITMCFTKNT